MSPTVVILSVGCLVAINCALVGTFLVLRKMALLGDAISHAVLPGIAIAFLLGGGRTPWIVIIGAGALGVLTVFLVELFVRTRRLKEDASIGVVFPALFAIGVVLISRYAYSVDIDTECVLYGEIAYSPWDSLLLMGKQWGPKALWVNGSILILDLLLVVLLFKELKLSSFDPRLCAALGFSPVLIHYLLMSAVSITVVGAFESVGAILVVAMLVVPPATAYLLSDRLEIMLVLGVVTGCLSAISGYGLSRLIDCSIAGAMACAAGFLFSLALLFSPTHGIVGRFLERRRRIRMIHASVGRRASAMTGGEETGRS